MDWVARGLPWDGEERSLPHVVDLVRADVPTCRLGERLADVRLRVQAAGWKACVVVNEANVVLGLLAGDAWHTDPQATAEAAMACAPRTFRPHILLEKALKYMQKHDTDHVLVTTGDGELLGLVRRDDAEESGNQGLGNQVACSRVAGSKFS
jgi:CBS domain-containing protein